MKKTFKKVICLVLAVIFVFSFAGCAKINYVTNSTIGAMKAVKDGSWENAEATNAEGGDTATTEDKSKIGEFKAGTYGGVKMDKIDDAVAYYVKAYNYTKSLTAKYKDEKGNTVTWYKLLGDEDLKCENIMVEGKSNSLINGLVPSIVNGLFKAGVYGLIPCNNRDPKLDNNNDDDTQKNKHDYTTSALKAEDVLACTVEEVDANTIKMTIQPKAAEMSMRGEDSQGRFFEVLGDIGSTVASISILSFSEGTAKENVKVSYQGGTGSVTINTKTGEITTADYEMDVKVAVSHACVKVIKDKSASLDITYKNHYPCSDEYLKTSKGATRV